jgi:hypothetical protein
MWEQFAPDVKASLVRKFRPSAEEGGCHEAIMAPVRFVRLLAEVVQLDRRGRYEALGVVAGLVDKETPRD